MKNSAHTAAALALLASLLFPNLSAAALRRKVLILGMDGLRSDALLAARAPHLKGLMARGSYTTEALADRLTRSGPGWTSILTGTWSPKHGVVDNEMLSYRSGKYPHLFRRVKEADPGLRTASLVNWEPIHGRLVSHADLSVAYGNDDSVAAAAERMLEREDVDVLFLHFDAPDYAGHRYGFNRFSPPYLSAIRRTDARVGRVLAALDRRPAREREEWLILGVTDHGGTLRHHGEDIPECRRVPLIVSGDAAAPGGRLDGAGLADVAPTVLTHLGIRVDPAWGMDGRPVGLRNMAERLAEARKDRSPGTGDTAGPGTGTTSERGLGGAVGDGLAGETPHLLEQDVR